MSVNYIAIVVAAIAHMIVGMLWYGPLFGKYWIGQMGWSEKDMKKMMKKGVGRNYVASFVSALVSAFILAQIISYFNAGVWLAVQLTAWLWLGFTLAQ